MLSYRHAFHAANAADVLKHSILVFCLDCLLRKEKPLLCVDTHAGAGRYILNEGFAAQKREWEQGLWKLTGGVNRGDATSSKPLPAMLDRYVQLCRSLSGGKEAAQILTYPGSPLFMAALLRPADRLVCFETHPDDYRECRNLLAGRAETRQEDSFSGLKSLLPPLSRRGIIFIDPPYEVKDDYIRLPETAADALRRFATGTYIIWYPLFRNPPDNAAAMPGLLMDLYSGNRCRVEFHTANPAAPPGNSPRGMYGSGMVIYNPPWTLAATLEESLPALDTLIGSGEGKWIVESLQ